MNPICMLIKTCLFAKKNPSDDYSLIIHSFSEILESFFGLELESKQSVREQNFEGRESIFEREYGRH